MILFSLADVHVTRAIPDPGNGHTGRLASCGNHSPRSPLLYKNHRRNMPRGAVVRSCLYVTGGRELKLPFRVINAWRRESHRTQRPTIVRFGEGAWRAGWSRASYCLQRGEWCGVETCHCGADRWMGPLHYVRERKRGGLAEVDRDARWRGSLKNKMWYMYM